MSEPIRTRLRSHFASKHVIAASLFANYAKAFDTDGSPAAQLSGITIAQTEEYLSYVSGAIILSSAGIEAYANDIFIEASDETDAAYSTIPTDVCNALRVLWPEMRRASAARKLEAILGCVTGMRDDAVEDTLQTYVTWVRCVMRLCTSRPSGQMPLELIGH